MLKILISNNLVTYLEDSKDILPNSDLWINVASTAEEILKIHRNENVDLIILELTTPQMGGDKLCAAVRQDKTLKDVSIILISPNSEDALERCFSCGANFVMTEPLSQQELITKVCDLAQVPQRENIRVLMNISVNGKSRDTFYSTSQNISTSGILLETNKVLNRGDTLTFSFMLRLNRVTAHGEVVRIEQNTRNLYQYGIKFINLDPQSKVLIENFVKNRQTV